MDRTRAMSIRTFSGLLLAGLAACGTAAGATELGIRDGRFTVNGKPAFLLGISYYGALGAREEFLQRDLEEMRRSGFNWIRLWATWGAFSADVSAVDPAGNAREPFLGKLRRLVGECDRMGLVVDVTLSRGNGATGPPRLKEMAAHRRAAETIVAELKPLRNWYLDLSNERNIRDERFAGFAELAELREAVRRVDPARLVTASHAGDISREDLREYIERVKVDFVAPHRPRHAGSSAETPARTREVLGWMREIGREVPIHYQEPFRRGFGGLRPGPAGRPHSPPYRLRPPTALDRAARGWSRGASSGRARRPR